MSANLTSYNRLSDDSFHPKGINESRLESVSDIREKTLLSDESGLLLELD